MSKMRLTTLALTMIAALAAAPALAADTATLDVTAEVLETCRFDTGGTLDFGNLDPLANTPVSVAASVAPTFTCSKGTIYTITDDAAAKPLINGTDTIAFSLAYAASATAADANPTSLPITGTIAAGAYGTVGAGTYASIVTLTINP